MPFGGWFDEYYSSIFCPAIESAGLVPRRADDLYRPSAIVHDIWAYTRRCRIVLADLTGKNPNVFYELGLAHAIAKPAILVTESIADVPFDLRALRVIEYNKHAPNWGQVLRQKIESSIREVLESPLVSVLPSFLEVAKEPRQLVSEHQKEFIEIRQELERMRGELRRAATGGQGTINDRVQEAAWYAAGAAPRITQDVALEQLHHCLSTGMPLPALVDHLVALGAPKNWVMRMLSQSRRSSSFKLSKKGGPEGYTLPRSDPKKDDGDKGGESN